ncbi:hypothetical protein [Lentzea flaviverrucosa]|uniref:Uncharacterized protein n=1 Tax=Lentzea flaviverrucosa TaxID=200379 RepID=A0A1H9XM47_9PSEU|nr:hypothetical protein [Lentzea flaviverrucosa]RDI20448.1 hypothetical protein DFR72_115291 [Lentzea flaviverrucosa]SES47184.1 hypothetical protein SAMN05216195_115291 [Lentzea flaviverrucosa]
MGLLSRLRDLLHRQDEPALSVDDPALVVVVEAFDIAEADSAALARSPQWRADELAVLRHHVRIPAEQVERARELLTPDGWVLVAGEISHISRVQKLDALHCAQERSRMASLAQRLGGEALGWDALQKAPEPAR